MSLSCVLQNPDDFKHIIRVLNTNLEGKRLIAMSLTAIKGIGRRFAGMILRRANISPKLRAGELSTDDWKKITDIIADPGSFAIPTWAFNRKKDYRDGNDVHVSSNNLDIKIREDIERMKKIKQHRGLRHHWLLKVRGQHTNSTGRRGVAIGVVRKKLKTE